MEAWDRRWGTGRGAARQVVHMCIRLLKMQCPLGVQTPRARPTGATVFTRAKYGELNCSILGQARVGDQGTIRTITAHTHQPLNKQPCHWLSPEVRGRGGCTINAGLLPRSTCSRSVRGGKVCVDESDTVHNCSPLPPWHQRCVILSSGAGGLWGCKNPQNHSRTWIL